jgi:hypothetical protein
MDHAVLNNFTEAVRSDPLLLFTFHHRRGEPAVTFHHRRKEPLLSTARYHG